VSIAALHDVNSIIDGLEAKRPGVASHCRRVAAYSVLLGLHYGLPEEMVETIRVGAMLHDIGKLAVPVHILSKAGRLTEREWQTLQSHPEQGYEMAERLGFETGVLDIILFHHERNDASGYPDGLDADTIPWTVRIVSVTDAYDALTSPRAYRAALSSDAARALLAREAADRYCPWVVSGLLSIPRSMLDAVAHGETDRFRADARPSQHVLDGATTPWTIDRLGDPGHITAW
jgi:putative nucleotidyltransferase with HDIG domain